MTDAEGDGLREAISQGPEVSDELRRRFGEQIERLLSRRLSVAGHIIRIVGALLMSAAALYCAGVIAMAGSLARYGHGREVIPFTIGFGAAFLFLAAGAFHCVYELRNGLVAPRRVQYVTFAIRYGAVFVVGLLVPAFRVAYGTPDVYDPTYLKYVVATNSLLTVYWSVAAVLAVYTISKWHREDALLEVKRVQLEMAELRGRLEKTETREA
jgi:hypothetical protein